MNAILKRTNFSRIALLSKKRSNVITMIFKSKKQIFQRPLSINRRNFRRQEFEDNFSVETKPQCADNYRLGRMNKKLFEKEIDALVVTQAGDNDAWEKPIFVNRKKIFSIVLPINVDKDILSGEPVFEGTRVPVAVLLDNLEAGASLNEFLENFPSVKREQAVQVLRYFKSSLKDFKKAA